MTVTSARKLRRRREEYTGIWSNVDRLFRARADKSTALDGLRNVVVVGSSWRNIVARLPRLHGMGEGIEKRHEPSHLKFTAENAEH